MMPFQSLLYLGAGIASLGFAIGTLFFLACALVGRRGDSRTRQFRLSLSSAVLSVASVVSAVAMYYLVLLPSTIQVTRPEYVPPYHGCSTVLAMAVPATLYGSAVLLIRAMIRTAGTRKGPLLMSLGALLATPPMYAAGYFLIYHVQVPALDHYVLIESRDWQTHIGDPAPDISVIMLDGTAKRLSDFRGELVLLNFFATWCGPCHAELPHLQALWNDLKANDGIQMLVVSRNETQDVVATFLSEQGFTFPVALDPDAAAFKQLAKESIPRTYLIGRDGTILFQTLGFSNDVPVYQRELATLRQTIDSELATNR